MSTAQNPNVVNIKTMLLLGGFSNDDLNAIAQTIQYARAQLNQEQKRTLRIGQQVKWVGKRGAGTGVITKIAIKYVTVKTATSSWRIPASMLSPA